MASTAMLRLHVSLVTFIHPKQTVITGDIATHARHRYRYHLLRQLSSKAVTNGKAADVPSLSVAGGFRVQA